MKLVLLGPQRLRPTLKDAVAALGVKGRIATVTAGWQELEGDDPELTAQLGSDAVNLQLHARGDAVFRRDSALAGAHRTRQERLQRLQKSYRVRLEHAHNAARIIARRETDPELLEEEARVSLEALRALDAEHLRRCDQVHQEFQQLWRPLERPAVAAERAELVQLLSGCEALAIAGGHVAVLLNRLRLFDLMALLPPDRPVLAWSAGAMVLAERIVLFHDDPPYGPGIPELFERGLAVAPGILPLPDPHARLRLDDQESISTLARRFAPAVCVGLPAGAQVLHDGERWTRAKATLRLEERGRLDTAWLA